LLVLKGEGRKMAALLRIFLFLLAWVLVLGPGSPMSTSLTSLLRSQAHADTSVYLNGSDGGYGQKGGDAVLLDAASGSDDYLYLEQYAFGGRGGDGDKKHPPGKGGYASSILTGLSLGTSSTSYNVGTTGGAGGYGASGSPATGGKGGDALAGFHLKGPGDIFYSSANATGGQGGDANGSGAGGQGGAATATSTATSFSSDASSSANAFGGYGGAASGNFAPGDGGDATATVSGTAKGNLTIYSASFGGTGGINPDTGSSGKSGEARATSTGPAASGSVEAFISTGNMKWGVVADASAPITSGKTSIADASVNAGQLLHYSGHHGLGIRGPGRGRLGQGFHDRQLFS
jgi:hypothetical protein